MVFTRRVVNMKIRLEIQFSSQIMMNRMDSFGSSRRVNIVFLIPKCSLGSQSTIEPISSSQTASMTTSLSKGRLYTRESKFRSMSKNTGGCKMLTSQLA